MTTETQRMSKTYEQRIADAEQAIADRAAGSGLVDVLYTGARTLALSDMGKCVTITNGSGVACTVPQDSDAVPPIPIGAECVVIQGGAGQVTITAGTGATLVKAAATAKILARYGRVVVRKVAANTWSTNGELAAS